MQAWLKERVAVSKRAAKLSTCKRCSAEVLAGDSHNNCSTTIRVDLEPIDYLTEVVTNLTGGHTAALIGDDLHLRDWITAPSKYPIHQLHQCTGTKEGELF